MKVINLKKDNFSAINASSVRTHLDRVKFRDYLISLGIFDAKVLRIDGIWLTADSLEVLCELLMNNEVIEVLICSSNDMSKWGVEHIAKFLKKSKTLKTLQILNNSIGSEGVQYIASALYENTSLQEIDLKGSRMGNEGVRCIASVIPTHPLRSIGLNYNDIGNAAAKELFYQLPGSGIEALLLEGNPLLKPDALEVLAEIFDKIPLLTELNIDGNRVRYSDIALKIDEKINKNIAILKSQLSADIDEILVKQSPHLCIPSMSLEDDTFSKLIDVIRKIEKNHEFGITINGYQRISKENITDLYSLSHKLAYLEMNSMDPIDTWENIYKYNKNKPKNSNVTSIATSTASISPEEQETIIKESRDLEYRAAQMDSSTQSKSDGQASKPLLFSTAIEANPMIINSMEKRGSFSTRYLACPWHQSGTGQDIFLRSEHYVSKNVNAKIKELALTGHDSYQVQVMLHISHEKSFNDILYHGYRCLVKDRIKDQNSQTLKFNNIAGNLEGRKLVWFSDHLPGKFSSSVFLKYDLTSHQGLKDVLDLIDFLNNKIEPLERKTVTSIEESLLNRHKEFMTELESSLVYNRTQAKLRKTMQ